MERLVHRHCSLRSLYFEFLAWGVLLGAILVFFLVLAGGGGGPLWDVMSILAASLLVSALVFAPLLKAPLLVQCFGFPIVAIVLPFAVFEGSALWEYGELFPPGPLPAALLGSIAGVAMLMPPSLICATIFYFLHWPVRPSAE